MTNLFFPNEKLFIAGFPEGIKKFIVEKTIDDKLFACIKEISEPPFILVLEILKFNMLERCALLAYIASLVDYYKYNNGASIEYLPPSEITSITKTNVNILCIPDIDLVSVDISKLLYHMQSMNNVVILSCEDASMLSCNKIFNRTNTIILTIGGENNKCK